MDAPSSLFDKNILEILFLVALNTPFASTPGCSKKFLSSADKKELIILIGIEEYGTKILFSVEKSFTSSPSPE